MIRTKLTPPEVLAAFSRAGILVSIALGEEESHESVWLSATGDDAQALVNQLKAECLEQIVSKTPPGTDRVFLELADWPEITIDGTEGDISARYSLKPV